MIRLGLTTAMLVTAYTPNGNIASQMREHDEYLKTKAEVTDALNKPAGPDYAAAVRIIERSSRVPLQKDYSIGNLILKACSEGQAYCVSPNDGPAGAARLARVAGSPDEDRGIAAGDLAHYLRTGAGPKLPPSPEMARCWENVHDGKSGAGTCPDPARPR